jgi:RHS repeat-associated protein
MCAEGAQGWLEGGVTYKQEYNYENLLSAVKKMNGTCTGGTVLETTSFLYDGDGNLVKKINPDGTKTIYVGGIYEVDKDAFNTVTRTVTYYPAGGAMRISIVGGSNSVYYILKDHLGSASVVTDSTGTIVGEQRYYPYGETRVTSGTIYTDKLFTGQREMAGLGIYHYGARFYSPRTGRFLSADTIVPGAANPQAFNRYSYVLGNPLRYTDPTGHAFYSDPYETSDGTCDPGDTSCNWVDTGNSNNNNNNGNDDHANDPLPPQEPEPEESDFLDWLFDIFDNYNYYGGTGDMPLFQLYTWMYDVDITARFAVLYSNNSPLTVNLFPQAGLRNVFYQTNDGFSLYGSTTPNFGYAQSLPHNIASSVSGINVNPITGSTTSELSIGFGPITIRESVTTEVTVRPMETLAATIGGGVALAIYFFGPVAGPEVIRQLAPALR